MNLTRTTPLWAKGLVVLAILAVFHPTARAGCNGCHYRPGNCPTLCNPETFGYFPTVWNLWPGPLDPNTSYPGVQVMPIVMPPAEKPVEKPLEKPVEKPK
jgi:hypothetical protein